MVSYSYEEAVRKRAPIGNPWAGDIITPHVDPEEGED